ncbi:MAG: hypothetical protein V3V09_03010 [Arenicellales bacterium]
MHTAVIDTHLHLYPNYDLAKAFNQLLSSSADFGPEVTRIACLAERHDCHYFQSIAQGDMQVSGFTLLNSNEAELTLKRDKDQLSLTLLPGRQVITQENIEVLALACAQDVADGQPALDVIYQVNQLNGVPVVAWSPGKWFGVRGELVKKLITELKPQDFMLGDTTLRPYGWGTPKIMQQAQAKGFGVIAGSDPLPFAGEESWLGTYYTVADAEQVYSPNELLHAMKQNTQGVQWKNTGKRTHVFNLFNRLRKNAASKKRQ